MNQNKGYKGIGPNAGQFVPAEDAFTYAKMQCGILTYNEGAPLADEFKEMLVEWYFSGNWIEAYEREDT